jgi:hypothetical protein
MWRSQVLPVLRGYDFVSFIDGTLLPPTPTINMNGVTLFNPAYTKWRQ